MLKDKTSKYQNTKDSPISVLAVVSHSVFINNRRSVPDSAPQISPSIPRICLILAVGLGISNLLKDSFNGLNLYIELEPKSLIHTLSLVSTYTAYGLGLFPGNFHSFHRSI